jgi:hypothetical protein
MRQRRRGGTSLLFSTDRLLLFRRWFALLLWCHTSASFSRQAGI